MTTLHVIGGLVGLVLMWTVVKQRLWPMILLNLVLGYYWFYSPTVVSYIFIGQIALFAVVLIASLIGASDEPIIAPGSAINTNPGKKPKHASNRSKMAIEEGLKEQRRIAEQQRMQEQFRADFAKHRK